MIEAYTLPLSYSPWDDTMLALVVSSVVVRAIRKPLSKTILAAKVPNLRVFHTGDRLQNSITMEVVCIFMLPTLSSSSYQFIETQVGCYGLFSLFLLLLVLVSLSAQASPDLSYPLSRNRVYRRHLIFVYC